MKRDHKVRSTVTKSGYFKVLSSAGATHLEKSGLCFSVNGVSPTDFFDSNNFTAQQKSHS